MSAIRRGRSDAFRIVGTNRSSCRFFNRSPSNCLTASQGVFLADFGPHLESIICGIDMLAESSRGVTDSIDSSVPVRPGDISQAAEKSTTRRHVLVVDDEPLLRWAIAETLGRRGYEISEAGDAESAMRTFAAPTSHTDLVLLDLCLPDSDDLRVLSFMRRLRPDTPVVLMTAHGTTEILDEAGHLGALVASKPFDMSDLAALVERTLTTEPH